MKAKLPRTADPAQASTADPAQASTADSAQASTADSAQASTADSAQASTADSAQASTADGTSPTGATGVRLISPLVLLVLAVVIAGAGVTLTVAGAGRRTPGANLALVDQAATRRVIATVSSEVSAAFSYSYTDIGATRRAAAAALTGAAARQYRLLFSQVVAHGPAERLTLTSRVVRAGVIRLSGGSAELLLFLDQKWVRGVGHGQPVAAAAQLDVIARLSGGHWRITAISAR